MYIAFSNNKTIANTLLKVSIIYVMKTAIDNSGNLVACVRFFYRLFSLGLVEFSGLTPEKYYIVTYFHYVIAPLHRIITS